MADLVEEGPDYLPSLEAERDYDRREASYSVFQQEPMFDAVDDSLLNTTVPEPVCLYGVGGTTVFGLSNKFDDEYPQSLTGKVAREEFQNTIDHLNGILEKSVAWNLGCLLCGCLCCCCTLGLSLGPGICFSKRTKSKIEKFLESENWRLYNKLNLNWRLSQEQSEQNSLKSYVLLIEFQPKLPLYRPD